MKEIEYLIDDLGILYRIDGLKHQWYNPKTKKWRKDTDDDDDIYYYRKCVRAVTEKEANEYIKSLEKI